MNKLLTATFIVLLAVLLVAQTPLAQSSAEAPATQAAPQTPPKPIVPPPPRRRRRRRSPRHRPRPLVVTIATLFVTGPTGTPIPDATITPSGPADREVVTTRDAATRITNCAPAPIAPVSTRRTTSSSRKSW